MEQSTHKLEMYPYAYGKAGQNWVSISCDPVGLKNSLPISCPSVGCGLFGLWAMAYACLQELF